MGINSNKKLRKLFYPIIVCTRWIGRTSPETLVRLRYFVRFHKFLNLKDPKDLNEKIQYLNLRTDTSDWTRLSDKHEVRVFVRDLGLEEILIPEYACYETADEIDFEKLPEKFVMKTTHGSGDALIVKDKSRHDIKEVKAFFSKMLKHRYGELEGGKHYMRIVPRLTVEALLENDAESAKYSESIIDYKFWCLNGEPRYCFVCSNRSAHYLELMIYDLEWHSHPEWLVFSSHYREGAPIPKPKNLGRMLEICKKLSEGFPCVRVDLYNLDGHVYFGEMTFTSLGGLMDYFTQEFLLQAGSEINLPPV